MKILFFLYRKGAKARIPKDPLKVKLFGQSKKKGITRVWSLAGKLTLAREQTERALLDCIQLRAENHRLKSGKERQSLLARLWRIVGQNAVLSSQKKQLEDENLILRREIIGMSAAALSNL